MKVLVAASGSGGHLFPAKFIMEEFIAQGDEVCFVGSGRGLEQSIIGPLHVPMHSINIVGLKNRGMLGLIQFICKTPGAFLHTRKILSDWKPDVVLGVGGYASFFPVCLASLMGIPTWIHEAELHFGLANRVLSFCADKVSVTSERVQFRLPPQKLVYTGHPVRRDIVQGSAWEGEKIPSRLLILGGSQGSRSLDLAISKLIPFFAFHKIEVFHQCRAESQEELRKEYAKSGVSAQVQPFIHELAQAYAWTHVILGRSGAGTVTEISLIGKPSIFVPYPHAQGNHQFFNAKTLEEKGKALIVEEGEGFEENLKISLEKIFDPQEFQKMRERGLEEKPVNAARKIADGVRGLARFTARS